MAETKKNTKVVQLGVLNHATDKEGMPHIIALQHSYVPENGRERRYHDTHC